jgi:hypothetical protein
MDSVEPPARDPHIYRPARDPHGEQLTPRHQPMLPTRKPGQGMIDATRLIRRAFTTHIVVNARLVGLGGGHTLHARGSGRAGGTLDDTEAQRKRGSSPPVPPLALIP